MELLGKLSYQKYVNSKTHSHFILLQESLIIYEQILSAKYVTNYLNKTLTLKSKK